MVGIGVEPLDIRGPTDHRMSTLAGVRWWSKGPANVEPMLRKRDVGFSLFAKALLALLAVAWVLLATDAHARRTPLTEAAISQALASAHRDVFGKAPSAARLLVARAQIGLEVGRGRWTYCHNLGNIGASRRVKHCTTKGGFRVRAYASPRAAARAYWRLSSVRKALPLFDAGDPVGAAYALRRGGYYTAPAAVYAERMAAVHRELTRAKGRK